MSQTLVFPAAFIFFYILYHRRQLENVHVWEALSFCLGQGRWITELCIFFSLRIDFSSLLCVKDFKFSSKIRTFWLYTNQIFWFKFPVASVVSVYNDRLLTDQNWLQSLTEGTLRRQIYRNGRQINKWQSLKSEDNYIKEQSKFLLAKDY